MVEAYNTGSTGASGRRMIAARLLAGTISDKSIFGAPGAIGEDPYDSHYDSGTYVIRRPCQTLPCFVIYY